MPLPGQGKTATAMGADARRKKEEEDRLAAAKAGAKTESAKLNETLQGQTGAPSGTTQAWDTGNQAIIENIRNQLGQSTDFGEIRRGGQQQVMDKAGAMSRQLQSGASRGGAAGRGAGTGALRAPAQQAMVQGMRGVERDVEAMKGARLQQVAAANAANTTAQLSAMGFDANLINMAIKMKEVALDKVGHRLEDPTFTPILIAAEQQYQQNISNGMDPVKAGAIYDSAVTMTSV